LLWQRSDEESKEQEVIEEDEKEVEGIKQEA